MTVELATIGNSIVLRCVEYPWRWYDAWGDNVVKYEMNMAGPPTDNTTGMPTEFINTLVNASTFTIADVLGGGVILTGAGAENDGVKLQLGAEAGTAGENVSFAHRYPTYFHARLQMLDVDQSDLLAGFFITDTTALDGGTDGIYFRTVDEDATLYFVLEQDSAETATAVATLTDATDIDLEFYYSAGSYGTGGSIYVYVNSALVTTIADTDANFCNDELLRLTLEFLSGEGAANTATIKRLGFIQIQDS